MWLAVWKCDLLLDWQNTPYTTNTIHTLLLLCMRANNGKVVKHGKTNELESLMITQVWYTQCHYLPTALVCLLNWNHDFLQHSQISDNRPGIAFIYIHIVTTSLQSNIQSVIEVLLLLWLYWKHQYDSNLDFTCGVIHTCLFINLAR